MKYQIMSAEMDNKGFVDIPEDAIVLSGLYHPVSGKFVVACMVPVEEEPEEEPEKKIEEKIEEKSEEKSESSSVTD